MQNISPFTAFMSLVGGHFAPMDEVNAANSPEDYARDYALSRLRSLGDKDQLPLF